MGNRRMLSLKVIDTDMFLDMPPTTQNLYFHLNIRADDDGFVSNPKKIMKIVSAADDDMKVLVAKQFVIPFESGVCVIKHWRVHNLIRHDRYTETEYKKEKNSLTVEENKYVIPSGNQPTTNGCPRLGKVRLGKDSIGEDTLPEKLIYGEFQKVKLTAEEFMKLVDRMGEQNTKILIDELDAYIASKGKRYSSHYATILTWARRKAQEMRNNPAKPKMV